MQRHTKHAHTKRIKSGVEGDVGEAVGDEGIHSKGDVGAVGDEGIHSQVARVTSVRDEHIPIEIKPCAPASSSSPQAMAGRPGNVRIASGLPTTNNPSPQMQQRP